MLIILAGLIKLQIDLEMNYMNLVDKDLMVVNNCVPTRKDRIIGLTIVSNRLKDKIINWIVQQEVYLNTDHSLISFNVGADSREELMENRVQKSEMEMACTEAVEKWMKDRRATTDINEDYKNEDNESLVSVIHKLRTKLYQKKEICRHSKGWWNPELTNLAKQYKKRGVHLPKDQMRRMRTD